MTTQEITEIKQHAEAIAAILWGQMSNRTESYAKRVFEKFREVRIYASRLTIIRIMAM